MNKYLSLLLFLVLFGTACSDLEKKIPELNVSEPCEVGTRKCSGSFIVTCVSTGRWATTEKCDGGCVSGQCKDDTPTGDECVDGAEGNAICNDGFACNGVEICKNGYCVIGTTASIGTECDDGNECTINDACVQNENKEVVCEGENQADRVCDDNNECTLNDKCTNEGICVGGTNLDNGSECEADGNICNGTKICLEGICTIDPDSLPPVGDVWPDGTLCDDGDICNGTGVCKAGACEQIATKLDDGTPCSDGNICNGIETCQGEVCTAGTNAPSGTRCDRNDGCSTGGHCSENGECVLENPAADNTSCDDGNACTINDYCTSGICNYTEDEDRPVVFSEGGTCDDGNECTGDGTCMAGICYSGNAVADNSVCDDGNPCTEVGTCLSGYCLPGQILADDTSCADENWCNGDEKCINGVCTYYPDEDRLEQYCDIDDEPCNGREKCTSEGICQPEPALEFGLACELPEEFNKPDTFTRERDTGQCFYKTCMYCGWSRELLYGGMKGRTGLEVLTDSSGNPHVFYVDGVSKALMHRSKNVSNIWTSEEVIMYDEGNTQRIPRISANPKIVIDSNNNFHVLYYDREEKGLYYTTDQGGYWGADDPQLLQTIGETNFYKYEVAIDPRTDKLWLVFEDPTFGVVHMTKTLTGNWTGGSQTDKLFNYTDEDFSASWPLSIAINANQSLVVAFVEKDTSLTTSYYRVVYAIDPQNLSSFAEDSQGRINVTGKSSQSDLYQRIQLIQGDDSGSAIFISKKNGDQLDAVLEFVKDGGLLCSGEAELPLAQTHLSGGFRVVHIEDNDFGIVAFNQERYGYFEIHANGNPCGMQVDGAFAKNWAKSASRVSMSLQPQTNPPLSFRGPHIVSLTDDYQVLNHHVEISADNWTSYPEIVTLLQQTVKMTYDKEGNLHRVIAEPDIDSGYKDLYYSDSDIWPPQGGAQVVRNDVDDDFLKTTDFVAGEDSTAYFLWEDANQHKLFLINATEADTPWSENDASAVHPSGWASSQDYLPGNLVLEESGEETRLAYTYGSGLIVNMGYGTETEIDNTQISTAGANLTEAVTAVNVWEDEFSAFVARKKADGRTYSLEYFEKTDVGWVSSSVWVSTADLGVDIRQLFHWNTEGEGYLNLLALGVVVGQNRWILHHWQRRDGEWIQISSGAGLSISNANLNTKSRVIGALDKNLAPHFIAQSISDPNVWTYFNYASNSLWYTDSYENTQGNSVYEVPELIDPMPTDGSYPDYPRLVVNKHGEMTIETMDDDYAVWRVRYSCLPVVE